MTRRRPQIIGTKRFYFFEEWKPGILLLVIAAFVYAGAEAFCAGTVFAIAVAFADLSNVMLVRQCAEFSSRQELWQEFQRRFLGDLRRWALQAVRKYALKEIAHYREAVDDLVQEVFLRLLHNDYQALREFRGNTDEALGAYLRVITQHMALNRLREGRAQKRPQFARSLDENPNDGSGDFTSHAYRETAVSDDEHERLHDLQEHLNYYLDLVLRGPQKHRDKLLFQLCFFDGMSAEEIANMPSIDMKPHAVEMAIHRVCKRLAKYSRQIMG